MLLQQHASAIAHASGCKLLTESTADRLAELFLYLTEKGDRDVHLRHVHHDRRQESIPSIALSVVLHSRFGFCTTGIIAKHLCSQAAI